MTRVMPFEPMVLDTEPRTRILECCFRRMDAHLSTHFVNRLASWWTSSPYIHCEFRFHEAPQRDGIAWTVTVDQSNPVILRPNKNYTLPGEHWTCVRLALSEREYASVWMTCQNHLGEPFDSSSIWWFPVLQCCMPNGRKNRWICSRLMAYSLCKARVLPGRIDWYRVSPHALMDLLMQHAQDRLHPSSG